MKRRSALRCMVGRVALWLGAVAAFGWSAQPARAYYFFYRYRFHYSVHRYRRRLRWRTRRG